MATTAPTSDVYYSSNDHGIAKNPWAVFQRLRDEAPLYYNADEDFYAVSRYDDVAKVLVDNVNYMNRYGGTIGMIKSGIEIPPGTVLFEDPPSHAIHRALLSRMFTPKKLSVLNEEIRKFATDVLDGVGDDGFDFATDLGDIVPMRVIGMLLGLPADEQVRVRDAITSDRPEPGSNEYGSGQIFNAEILVDYVKWRKENPSNDVVTELLTAEFDDESGQRRTLHLDELLMYVNVLAAAGNETTGRLITFFGQLLAEHPDQRRAVAEDLSLAAGAIEEVLRYEPPAIEACRVVANDVEFYGQTVPAGSAMAALLASANRDERHYENPDTFDIHRKASNMTLSFGPHYCLGANLARLEGRIVLEEVLKRYPEWEIDWDRAKFDVSPPLRSWEKLPVLPKKK